jgi:hypothetical protein
MATSLTLGQFLMAGCKLVSLLLGAEAYFRILRNLRDVHLERKRLDWMDY